MNILVVDVETTGLISNKTPTYITQLSFAVYDTGLRELIKTYNSFIKIPPNIIISDKITEITGITREKLDMDGIDITDALEEFYNAYCRSDIIVAHNISFDSKMIEIEATRNQAMFKNSELAFYIMRMFTIHSKLSTLQLKCTMRKNIDLCNIQRINSRGNTYKKFPTLSELYEKLFDVIPENLHNSMIDVLVCLRCYLKIDHNIDISDSQFGTYIINSLNISITH